MTDSLFDISELHPPTALSHGKLSPKRPTFETAGMADIFPYYAGFSFDWAKLQLKNHNEFEDPVVLDPWNGSGTTTLAAQSLGIRSIGIDLNPVANIVATLRANSGSSALPLKEIIKEFSGTSKELEPLRAWFAPGPAARIRERVNSLCSDSPVTTSLGLVSLFRVVRTLTKAFEGSNPTWVRRASPDHPAIEVDLALLDRLITEEQNRLHNRLKVESASESLTSIITASSASLPLNDNSVDMILTSPPYMTRIDYAVAYARELAILGIDLTSDRSLREGLMGTTLIRKETGKQPQNYGLLATELVERVQSHPSKASSGYYLKQVRQYLDDLLKSFDEITRVAKPRSVAILVVQDSYYKDVPIKLAEICMEEAERRGWDAQEPELFEVNRLLTKLNTPARAYSKGKVNESVITLKRGVK